MRRRLGPLTGTIALVAAMVLPASASSSIHFESFGDVAEHNVGDGVVHMITGQAWGDPDGDGDLDLYVTNSVGPNSLLLYEAGGFVPSPYSPSVALPAAKGGGAVFADYDNDGWADLYVLNSGPNALFHNDAGAGFTEVAAAAGVDHGGHGETATWADFDGDGLFDLYVVNWQWAVAADPLSADVLYHNNGDGTFSDWTAALEAVPDRIMGPGFAATWLDYDNDGDSDLYAVNDKHWGNLLWRNDGPGCALWCFTDVSVAAGAHRPAYSMGIAVADYDGDLDLDMYYSSGREQVLLQNQTSQGSPTFVEVSIAAGVSPDAVGWGNVFADFDNDGLQDLYLSASNKPNSVFRNLGDGTFADVSTGSGADDPGRTLGVAAGDFDRDGFVDLVIGNWGFEYRVFHNAGTQGDDNHWLSLRLEGSGPVNRDAIGARALVTTPDGTTRMLELKSGSSLGSGNSLDLHFGLGANTTADVVVLWPDGTEEAFPGVLTDQHLGLLYGSGAPVIRCAGLVATLVGTSGDDVLVGTGGVDVIAALDGNDSIEGKGQDDVICAGAGNDTVNAGSGSDRVFGGAGDDILMGSTGDDDLRGGAGDDRLAGGGGDDVLAGQAGADIVSGNDGDDRLFGGEGDDVLRGNEGADVALGGDGADTIYGDDGGDILLGGNGPDRLFGGADRDVVRGGGGDDVALGGEGNDIVRGGSENDLLRGDRGDDKLYGEDGDDSLVGGPGTDRLNGGPGGDTCSSGEVLISC